MQLFHELRDKQKGTEYLEILLRYLAGSARNLTEEDIEGPVKKIIEGGDLMATIAEKWVEQGKEIGKEIGREEGRKEERKEMAKKLVEKGIDLSIIAEATGLSRKEVDALALAH